MKIVGLTGGIGSGKSYIANIFNINFSIPVYNSDYRAKFLMNEKESLRDNIKEILGEESYLGNKLNTKFISEKIFHEDELRERINNILRLDIKEDFDLWFLEQKSSYVIKESAILFETATYLDCDFIITIFCDLEERIDRIMKRDNHLREHILKIIKTQLSEDEKISKSDFVIYNSQKDNLLKQIEEVNNIITS